jgi:hypothetical protein
MHVFHPRCYTHACIQFYAPYICTLPSDMHMHTFHPKCHTHIIYSIYMCMLFILGAIYAYIPFHAPYICTLSILRDMHMHAFHAEGHTYASIAYIHMNSTASHLYTTNACSFSRPNCHTYAYAQFYVPYIRIDCPHTHEFNTYYERMHLFRSRMLPQPHTRMDHCPVSHRTFIQPLPESV